MERYRQPKMIKRRRRRSSHRRRRYDCDTIRSDSIELSDIQLSEDNIEYVFNFDIYDFFNEKLDDETIRMKIHHEKEE